MKIAIIGNFPPRRCGIAEFTADFASSIYKAGADVLNIAMNDREEGYEYGSEVDLQIRSTHREAYALCGEVIEKNGCTALSLQHEYGIFGGKDGEWILDLAENTSVPIFTTLHTVLQDPSPNQYRILNELAQRSTKLVTMAEKGRQLLQDVYGVNPKKIEVIPHPIPSNTESGRAEFRMKNNLGDEPVLATFGLLSPNKGIEDMIRAMAVIRESHSTAKYVVAGRTHPHIQLNQGEEYRERLVTLISELGLENNIVWIDRFVSKAELLAMLTAIEIYVTPYHNMHQITSGTLSYAFGLGNAVVSTPYWHAQELLGQGRGVLVPPADPQSLAKAITRLLDNPDQIRKLQMEAKSIGRNWTWDVIAESYMNLIADTVGTSPEYVTA